MRGFAIGASQIELGPFKARQVEFGPIEARLRKLVSAATGNFTPWCECKICKIVNNRFAISTKRHLHDLSLIYPNRGGGSWANPFKFALLCKPVTVRQTARHPVSVILIAKSIRVASR